MYRVLQLTCLVLKLPKVTHCPYHLYTGWYWRWKTQHWGSDRRKAGERDENEGAH